ncbi:MAG: hypothetical protein GX163_10630 [Bacteroidetes bacterium]|jgi:hypothetical protein|nr:hypothetical protein [Bacteroidota bacterium]
MIKFIPYTEDPFLQPPLYRVVPLEQTDMGYYTLFIKNLIAAHTFENFDKKDFPSETEIINYQTELFGAYINGDLQIRNEGRIDKSPVTRFMEMEVEDLQFADIPEVESYLNFLVRHRKVFECIDRAVDYEIDDSFDYESYLDSKIRRIDFFEITEVIYELIVINLELVEQLKKQLIANLEIQKLNIEYVKGNIDALNYHFNNKLVDSVRMAQVKHHSVIWFGQLLRKIGFEIGWHDYKDFFDEMKSLFCEAINYQPPVPEIANIPYPKHIFTDPKAYLLFHEIASKTSKNIIISYLFRRMGERENFISVRDTEFRDWFNTAGYPKELYSPTHTYEKSYTEERELFVNLLYEKYGLGE